MFEPLLKEFRKRTQANIIKTDKKNLKKTTYKSALDHLTSWLTGYGKNHADGWVFTTWPTEVLEVRAFNKYIPDLRAQDNNPTIMLRLYIDILNKCWGPLIVFNQKRKNKKHRYYTPFILNPSKTFFQEITVGLTKLRLRKIGYGINTMKSVSDFLDYLLYVQKG